jgi:cytoskeletal protein CcmA (bactofilin family)
MDESIINNESVLGDADVNREISQAVAENREINFAGKKLRCLALAEKDIDRGINLENSTIFGNIFLANATVNGNVNLSGASIYGSLFLGQGTINGDLYLQKSTIGQSANMVGLKLSGSLNFAGAQIHGFVSLAKAVIKGNVDLQRIETRDYSNGDLTVKGDIYLKDARINGTFNMTGAKNDGVASLENAVIGKNLTEKTL